LPSAPNRIFPVCVHTPLHYRMWWNKIKSQHMTKRVQFTLQVINTFEHHRSLPSACSRWWPHGLRQHEILCCVPRNKRAQILSSSCKKAYVKQLISHRSWMLADYKSIRRLSADQSDLCDMQHYQTCALNYESIIFIASTIEHRSNIQIWLQVIFPITMYVVIFCNDRVWIGSRI